MGGVVNKDKRRLLEEYVSRETSGDPQQMFELIVKIVDGQRVDGELKRFAKKRKAQEQERKDDLKTKAIKEADKRIKFYEDAE